MSKFENIVKKPFGRNKNEIVLFKIVKLPAKVRRWKYSQAQRKYNYYCVLFKIWLSFNWNILISVVSLALICPS